jgi:hypothetical protein
MRFSRHGDGVTATTDPMEAAVLRQCASDILDLVEPATISDDPLAALVGLPEGEVEQPDNPVLLRLLPDAYRGDADAAADFRRYTDADLRATKRAHATAMLETIPEQGGEITLDRDQVDIWLGCLNDIRLALGTALDVSEDTDYGDHDADDPQNQALGIYAWLGYLQESLLSCIDPRVP